MSNLLVRGGMAALGAAAAFALAGPTAAHAGGYTAPACGNHTLTVTRTASDSGMGHGGLVLRFRNHTANACTLYGYPGVDALGGYGTVLRHAARTKHGYMGGAPLSTVTVLPGHFASATLEWLNFNPVNGGDCRFSSAIAVTPANTSHTVDLPGSVSVCNLQVHPTVAGTSGRHS